MANRNFASRLPREGQGLIPITACASLCFMQSLPHTVHVTFVSPAFGRVLICGFTATPTTPSMPLYGEGFHKGTRNNPGGGGWVEGGEFG